MTHPAGYDAVRNPHWDALAAAEKARQMAAHAAEIGVITWAAAERLVHDAYEREVRNGA